MPIRIKAFAAVRYGEESSAQNSQRPGGEVDSDHGGEDESDRIGPQRERTWVANPAAPY